MKNNNNKKQIFLALVLLLLITASITGINTLTNYPSLRIKNYQLFPYNYSISIINNSKYSSIYKISPYDDKLTFKSGYWRAVVTEKENLTNKVAKKQLSNWFYRMLQNLLSVFNKARITFITNGDFKINYKILKNSNGFTIERNISGFDQEALKLTKTFLFSTESLVFDSKGTVHFNPTRNDTFEKLPLQKSINNLENKKVCYIVVTELDAAGAVLIPIRDGEQWRISEKHKNIQIDEPVKSEKDAFQSKQKIILYNTINEFFASKDQICF